MSDGWEVHRESDPEIQPDSNVVCRPSSRLENADHEDAEKTTALLQLWQHEGPDVRDRLLRRLYSDLLQVARRAMRGERKNHTLQPTALVHEAYLRLAEREISWQDRGHFFAVVARTMRRVLVDHARAQAREKRGGEAAPVAWQDADGQIAGPDIDLISLDRALDILARRAPKACQALELCYFAGLSYAEIAQALDLSRASVARELQFGRAWLRSHLSAPCANPARSRV